MAPDGAFEAWLAERADFAATSLLGLTLRPTFDAGWNAAVAARPAPAAAPRAGELATLDMLRRRLVTALTVASAGRSVSDLLATLVVDVTNAQNELAFAAREAASGKAGPLMAGWVYLVYLAYRDQGVIGVGERLEDAQQLCATDAAKRGERIREWRPAQKAPQWDNAVRPRTVLHGGRYGVKRVAVARYADEGGG